MSVLFTRLIKESHDRMCKKCGLYEKEFLKDYCINCNRKEKYNGKII